MLTDNGGGTNAMTHANCDIAYSFGRRQPWLPEEVVVSGDYSFQHSSLSLSEKIRWMDGGRRWPPPLIVTAGMGDEREGMFPMFE
ncbi:hypothetical protein VNO77_20994 [Canavalia gladiata]|uniref:Uncharacterized protein n=1 Tax=Canavalia gladiata TaxID=3824 RepID=A0AAN9QLW6_CANGL